MTKDEKDSVDTEISQMDVPVDSQPQDEHEGRQNEPPVNLPQLSAQSEVGSSQARSGGRDEINVNVMEEEKDEELPGQVSTAVEQSSTETESLSISTRIKIYKYKMTEHLWLYLDRLCSDAPVSFTCITVAFFSLFGSYTFTQYLDFFTIILCICIVTLLLPCVERTAGYSILRKCMGECTEVDELPCPCKSKKCNHGKSSRSRSRSRRRVLTRTKFEHEVADPSSVTEDNRVFFQSRNAPEFVFEREKYAYCLDVMKWHAVKNIEYSHSTERPESPKAVNVDVYSNVESPGCSEAAFVIPPTHDTSVRSKTTPFRPRPPSPSGSV